ncbi:MAG: hypothetical protein IT464_16285 [Planctomycetes bacterium]|nr:hypothetical protein [Planctomycetota bacterium]
MNPFDFGADYTCGMGKGTKVAVVVTGLVVGVIALAFFAKLAGLLDVTYTVEREDITPPKVEDLLADDKLADKNPSFDPALIDSRPFGEPGNQWQINASAAVIRLDVPAIRDDSEEPLRRLYPNFAEAAKAMKAAGLPVLPSVNLIGGKAKQFDDGLYAAIDTWAVQNDEGGVRDVEKLVRQVLTELNPGGEPYAWLWGSLEAGGLASPDEHTRRPPLAEKYVAAFLANESASTPVGFYVWNENLQRVFRFLRYLQQPIPSRQLADAIARVVGADPEWRSQYQRMLELYAGMTNPFVALNLLALADAANVGKSLDEIAKAAGVRRATVHFLPYSDNRETALFERLYPTGAPAHADLMRDFIRAIRGGTLELTPREGAGWYEYQIYALETFLLPERGTEHAKLLLTKQYKLRMLEAFKAMVTKTRETHIRQSDLAVGSAAAPPAEGLAPRLRCEPNPTYYLRIARSYAFVQKLLLSQVQDLNAIRGARESGPRGLPLGDELEHMRMLFYGLHLVSCEDIGMAAQTLPGEIDQPDYLRVLASKWLEQWESDVDLAADTRVAVPVYVMPGEYTRFWCTVGVRAMKLTASYAKAPTWRPMAADGAPAAEWTAMESWRMQAGNWILLGDEFAEVERQGDLPLTRKELRDICNHHGSKQAIIEALQR